MIIKNHKKAFTLVELIVVITILAILGTIGYIYISDYGRNARNSVRISDIKTIRNSLEYIRVEKGVIPNPTNQNIKTYSGAEIRREGTFGSETIGNTKGFSNIPLDPLAKVEYVYSITNNNKDYQLGLAMEGEDFIDRSELVINNIINKTNAASDDLLTYTIGTYKGKIITTSTGGVEYILASPSIISSDNTLNDIQEMIDQKKMAYRGYANLPFTYSGVLVNQPENKVFDLSGKDIVLFRGKIADLEKDIYRKIFYENLAKFYGDSQLRFKKENEDYTSVYIDAYNPIGNISDIACKITIDLIKVPCTDMGFDSMNGSGELVNTGALELASQTGSYIGQWTFGTPLYNQGLQNADHTRSAIGMPGSLSMPIGTKWKVFAGGKAPDNYIGGYDIDGDGTDNILYGYGGKLFLGDTETLGNVWESKIYDIKKVLGVESILSDGSKSIIVAMTNDWIIGVINGKTGILEWNSFSVSGPVNQVKLGWPGIDYKIFDINNDGVREYHFKQRYNKYNSFKFFESGGKVIGETLWSSQGYGDYNNGSDGYQVNQFSMGNISGKKVIGTKGSNTFTFYSNDVNSSLSGINAYKMPAFGKLNTGGNSGNGRGSGIGYFYDINGDGNDEYISKLDEEINNNKLSRVFISGLNSSNQMVQYSSLSNPATLEGGTLKSYGNFSTPIALKNSSNTNDSYIITKGKDPNDLSTDKWMMLKYNGNGDSGYKQNSAENESFNTNIIYDKFDASYSISGIFNNGNKDYIVLYKSGKFYFYTFTGVDTFLSTSSLTVTGGFYGDNMFIDTSKDLRREENKNAGVFLSGVDTDGNGLKEFVITEGGYFRFYEITDSGTFLKKSFYYNGIPGVIKWGITSDLKDVYGISYDSVKNTINYYKSNSDGGNFTLTKRTDDDFVSGGQTRDLLISKLGSGADKYNKVMIQGVGMFDARNANPKTLPTKLSNDFFYSYDMDNDGDNEIFKNDGKAYIFNSPGNYTLKYNSEGWGGDFNGDGVSDLAWSYCAASVNFVNNLYLTVKSGSNGTSIVPDIDWGNGNGYCSGGGKYTTVAEDFDSDGLYELAVGVRARRTRLLSFQDGNVIEGNTVYGNSDDFSLISFDVDGDGKKEIIRSKDNVNIFKGNPADKTKLTSLADISGNIKSTWGISGGSASVYKKDDITYFAFRGVDGQVSLRSFRNGSAQNLFNNYYVNLKKYNDFNQVINNNEIPLASADVLLGDFIGDGTVQVLVGGGDGYIYILGINGDIRKAYEIGSWIDKIIFGDTNENGVLDILVSSKDGYVHQIASSILNPPIIIRDGQNIGNDDRSQSTPKKTGLHFEINSNAKGYFVQLYNRSKKSIVFDWIDIGNNNSACIVSPDEIDSNCLPSSKKFKLIKGDTYQWRVQSYDDNIASPTALSNGFISNY